MILLIRKTMGNPRHRTTWFYWNFRLQGIKGVELTGI
jgi:hypothetical protein